jgi:hypothetical protein
MKVLMWLTIICAIQTSVAFVIPLQFRPHYAKSRRLNKILTFAKEMDDIDSLRLDESKLSASEKERLEFIQKLTNEADQIVTAAGFKLDVSLTSNMVVNL